MSMRYLGGLLTATQNPLTGTPNDSGLFTLQQQIQAIGANQWTGPQDPFFKNVTLLLEADTLANGAQNNTFLDSSSNNFTITRNGNTTQGSFSPYGNLWSHYFDGNSDYLSVASNSAFWFGSGDFTVEVYVYPTRASGKTSLITGIWSDTDPSAQSWLLSLNSSGQFSFIIDPADTILFTSDSVVPNNKWTHLAITRSGNTWRMFIDGVIAKTATNTTTLANGSGFLGIGGHSSMFDATTTFNGYMSSLRIVKGTALYTSNFTPSTTPLTAVSGTSLLTCQSNRFKDNSSNNFTITRNGDVSVQRFSPFNPTSPYSTSVIGGSGYFDGVGDYLTVPSSSSLALGSGAYTVEGFVYLASYTAGGSSTIFSVAATGGSGFYVNSAGNPLVDIWGTGILATSTGVVPLNQWVHVAFVRTSTATNGLTFYINGVSAGTATDNRTWSATGTGYIGGIPGYAANVNGYLSNIRVVKGTAVYTTTFTPPTAPLTAITNTSLLCNFTNAGIYDSAMLNDLETVGNAQVSTAIKKYGTGSLSFDGTGDGIRTASIPPMSLGTGDFTMEFWLYPLSQPSSFNAVIGTSASGGPILNLRGSGTSTSIGLNAYGSADIFNISYTFTQSTWVHVAVTRSGTSLKLFINGTQTGTTVTNSTNFSGYISEIGTADNGNQYFNGYIDDLRITKGVARYTANFTPPTQQLPNQ
jgi:Concanavalin A-like lectin/glucanases superfamily